MTPNAVPSIVHWPLFYPAFVLVYSRKFLIGVLALFVDFVIALAPVFEGSRLEMIAATTWLAGWLVLQIGNEDAAHKRNGGLPATLGPESKAPVINPVVTLFKSENFIYAIAAVIINYLIVKMPALDGMEEILITTVTGLLTLIIHTVTKERIAAIKHQKKTDLTPKPTDRNQETGAPLGPPPRSPYGTLDKPKTTHRPPPPAPGERDQ